MCSTGHRPALTRRFFSTQASPVQEHGMQTANSAHPAESQSLVIWCWKARPQQNPPHTKSASPLMAPALRTLRVALALVTVALLVTYTLQSLRHFMG